MSQTAHAARPQLWKTTQSRRPPAPDQGMCERSSGTLCRTSTVTRSRLDADTTSRAANPRTSRSSNTARCRPDRCSKAATKASPTPSRATTRASRAQFLRPAQPIVRVRLDPCRLRDRRRSRAQVGRELTAAFDHRSSPCRGPTPNYFPGLVTPGRTLMRGCRHDLAPYGNPASPVGSVSPGQRTPRQAPCPEKYRSEPPWMAATSGHNPGGSGSTRRRSRRARRCVRAGGLARAHRGRRSGPFRRARRRCRSRAR